MNEIRKDGFVVNKAVEILLASDTPTAISKSIGLAMISISEAWAEINPDIIVILGDRYEAMAAALAALVAGIPVAHIHGGETTEGAIDEALRHSITKISQIHFASTEDYRRRIIQLGEHPETVFNVGSLGLDRLDKVDLIIDRSAFEKTINFKLGERSLLVTYHPETLGNESSKDQFSEVLAALRSVCDTTFVFTYPNADPEGQMIIEMIEESVCERPDRSIAFASLGQQLYFSALLHVDGVVGNSSSGIIEVPSFHIGTVDIGNRQKGRIRPDSVVHCAATRDAILSAVNTILSETFIEACKEQQNPYKKPDTAREICRLLEQNIPKRPLQKQFYDLECASEDCG